MDTRILLRKPVRIVEMIAEGRVPKSPTFEPKLRTEIVTLACAARQAQASSYCVLSATGRDHQ